MENISDKPFSMAVEDDAVIEYFIKNSDYDLVIPDGYTLENLRKMIQKSVLKEQCDFVNKTSDITEICHEFKKIFEKSKSIEEMAAIYPAAYMIYMMSPYTNYSTIPDRLHLLNRAFQEADTLWPHHLNYLVEQMVTFLKVDDDNDSYEFNLVKRLPWMAHSSETGKMIAVAIARFLVAQKCGKEIQLHSFKGFSELLEMLDMIDLKKFIETESFRSIYVLINAIGFILQAVAFGSNEFLIQYGYRNMKLNISESKKLYAWSTNLRNMLDEVHSNSKYNEIVMDITRYITIHILILLAPDDSELLSFKRNF